MIKYKDTYVVFEEIPDKITLAINITNCQNRCVGCHSPELRCDIGTELTIGKLKRLIEANDGINCVCFMGEGNDTKMLKDLAAYIHIWHPNIDTAIYSGREEVENDYYGLFDYVKIGPYKEEFGPLNKETTNQRMYKYNRDTGEKEDITYKFWNRR